ncbi:MAG: PaaI family thioesterase [Sphingomonas sp.]
MSKAAFLLQDASDHPGWAVWDLDDPTRFNGLIGPLLLRVEDGVARVRMTPERRHSNLQDDLHGGALLGFVDCVLFAAAQGFGLETVAQAVTLDLSVQFIGAGAIGEPLEARVELLRETGRLLFLRGLVVQGDGLVANFSGTVRKPPGRR